VNNESEAGTDSVPLKPVEQALILAQCLLIERGSRHDAMQSWDMAPYIEAIDSQKSTYFVNSYGVFVTYCVFDGNHLDIVQGNAPGI
jgi:hypothetical protein